MAERKKKSEVSASPRKKTSQKSKKDESGEQLSLFKEREKKPYDENSAFNLFMPYVLFFASILVILTFVFESSMMLLGTISGVLKGLFGAGVFVLPLYLIIQSFMWKIDAPKGHIKVKVVCAFFFALFLASLIHMIKEPDLSSAMYTQEYLKDNTFGSVVSLLYEHGATLDGGGVLGGGICMLLFAIGGKICVGFVSVVAVVVFGLFLFGWTINDALSYSGMRAKELYYDAAEMRRQRKEKAHIDTKNLPPDEKQTADSGESEQEDSVFISPSPEKKQTKPANKLDVPIDEESPIKLPTESTLYKNGDCQDATIAVSETEKVQDDSHSDKRCATDICIDENDEIEFPEEGSLTDLTVFEQIKSEKQQTKSSEKSVISFDEIFTEDATIAGAGTAVDSSAFMSGDLSEASEIPLAQEQGIEAESEMLEAEEKPSPEEMYEFPPFELMKKDPNPATFEINEELRQTSIKLVETLASFGVKTKIMNICCGPTVTRYELKPDVGVKVRSIQNLTDDIALHLSASGVRIEAPIPGKDAVGIEIPNKTVSTVYIRNLIESPTFSELKSKVSMCLGMDVAGSPIYIDMAKMPHLLIAGATGMGKSVCINSFIVSLLYKSRPDEVKLILIDPKKVEFEKYDGIPHLLVPVVSEPKKAAGSLAWAVNEMERRFTLISSVGARDIKNYNRVTANDPSKEFLPLIVIIIDELADLMMAAKDEVETSICRLAQKARAAGMHIIIGTQRPSVDVITGLIKANVPSRIAFTVASQVDSRTIIDVAGAERLMGRGDMLYAPVGCMKPMRVQGSFVDEDEVEAIAEFLKGVGVAQYDTAIIDSIEKEALHCGEKKSKKGGGDTSADESGFVSGSKEDILTSDDMILPAIELGLESGQISTSLIQRRLSLGYARAARIIDKLESLGFVSQFEGSKPRRITISTDEYMELKMKIDEQG